MADLLDPDALNQVLERLRIAARIKALKKILHHRAHFPKLTTEAFLENVCGCRIGFVGSDRVDQLLNMEKHTSIVSLLTARVVCTITGDVTYPSARL